MPSPSSSSPAINIPRPVIFLASIAIAFHLIAIVANVLAAPSGPWPFQEREGLTMPPQFAQGLTQAFGAPYLKFLHMTSNYHFMTNRPGSPDAYIEARLKNRSSGDAKTAKFPDPSANFWVRHRQSLLAQALGGDMPYNLEGERAPPEGKDAPRVTIWKQEKDGSMKLDEEREHEIRDLMRSGPVIRPSDLSRILARSYSRFLSRLFPEASAEVIRRSRNSVSPTAFSMGGPPPQAFEDMVANFGGAKP